MLRDVKYIFIYTHPYFKNMEKRRIIKLGKSSYVISLPKDWALKFNLKEGDWVFLEVKEDELRISPSKFKIKGRVGSFRIDAEHIEEPVLASLIKALYKAGYNEIVLSSDRIISPQLVNTVKKTISNLFGVEITHQRPREIVLKIRTENIEPKELINNEFSLVLGAMEYALALVEERNAEYLENLEFIQEIFLKIHALIIRVLDDEEEHKRILMISTDLGRILNLLIKIALLVSLSLEDHLLQIIGENLKILLVVLQETKDACLKKDARRAKGVITKIADEDFLKTRGLEKSLARLLNSYLKDMVSSYISILENIIIS